MSTFDKMVDFLDAAWPIRQTIVPCLVGAPGIGKTAAVKQHAKNVGAKKVVIIIASQILPNEVSGITMPDVNKQAMMIYDHYRLSSLEDGDILFFDELLEADQMVLSACLTLIESRQMMSGTMLPDVQIIAATNPTIKPNMLKSNIRQRFLWGKFGLDKQGCFDFIKNSYGIEVPDSVLDLLVEDGNEYNILTQRSLTKMVAWLDSSTDLSQAKSIAKWIDYSWASRLGSTLLEAYKKKLFDPEQQFKKAVNSVLSDKNIDIPESIVSGNVTEFIKFLQALPEWSEIEAELSKIEIEEDSDDMEISF